MVPPVYIEECSSKLSVAAPLAKAPPQFEGSCQSKREVCEGGWELLAVDVIVMVTAQIHWKQTRVLKSGLAQRG